MARFGFFSRTIPDPNNRVTIDTGRTDLFGNNVPILNFAYDNYSLDGAMAAIDTFGLPLWSVQACKTQTTSPRFPEDSNLSRIAE